MASPHFRSIHILLGLAALVATGFLLYAPTLDNYFLGDDYTMIAAFHGKGGGHLVSLLFSDEIHGTWSERFLRPVRTWSLALDSALWGLNPLGYHLSDILLHAAASAAILLSILNGDALRAIEDAIEDGKVDRAEARRIEKAITRLQAKAAELKEKVLGEVR